MYPNLEVNGSTERNGTPGVYVVHSESTANMAASTAKLTDLKQMEADGYDPFANRDTKHQYSDLGAMAHLLKGSLGSGVLAMPMAFKNGGLVVGAIGTAVVGFLCTHAVLILVSSSQHLCNRIKVPSLGFAETAEAAFDTGPKAVRGFSTFARRFVTTALFSTYYFSLSVYIVFIADSCKQLLEDVKDDNGDPRFLISKKLYIALVTVVMIPLGLFRNLKHLIPFSTIANICIVVGSTVLLYYLLRSPKDVNSRELYPRDFSNIAIFFVTVLFAMEGIGTVMPVENTMRNPHHLGGSFGILSKAMIIVMALFAVIGFLGYLEYGNATLGSVTLSMPTNEWGAKVVKGAFAICILFTYPLQFHVPCGILWSSLSPKLNPEKHNLYHTLMRIAMIIVIGAIAMVIPRLDIIISLVASLFFSILGLFIPPVVEIVTYWEKGFGPLNWVLWKDLLFVVLSLFATVAGTYTSVIDAIRD